MWECPYCGKQMDHELGSSPECCGEVHCFEFNKEDACPECGTGDTTCGKQTDHNGECHFQMCNVCGHLWNFG